MNQRLWPDRKTRSPARGISRTATCAASWLAIALITACSPQSATGPTDSNETEEAQASHICPALYAPTGLGSCQVVTHTRQECSAAAVEIEDTIGQRIAGWETFSRGLIVKFQDGTKLALWSRRIDCIDPPFSPLSNAEQTVQPDSGDIVPTGAEPAPTGSPLEIPSSQTNEPWLVGLRDRQEANECGPNPVNGRTASLNGKFEYLEVCSWATSNMIIQRRVSDGHLKEISDGSNLKVVRNGPWMGFLAITRHKYHPEGGSYDPVSIVRPDGKEMFEVPGTAADESGEAFSNWLTENSWVAN